MNRMNPLAFIVSQNQMRRALIGACATDPVVAERHEAASTCPPRLRSPEELKALTVSLRAGAR